MKLFSERFKDIASFPLVTYSEVVEVKYGYTEATDQNTINILCSRKWGFVEIVEPEKPVIPGEAEESSLKAEIPKSEETPGKPALKSGSTPKAETTTEPKTKKSKPKPKPKPKPKGDKESGKGTTNAALSESDVDAFTGRH